jgi:hypothetical protein
MVSANHMSIDVCHPKSAPVQPRSSATPAAKPPLPLEKKKIGDVRLTPTWTKEEQAAAAALVVSLTALGLTSLAALLLQIRAGYPRSQALADLLNALKGRFPPDPFEAWKRKYTSLGWRYAESGGVAHFDPVAGSRNEQGWIYDAEQGTFVPPGTPRTPLAPHDGQVDPVTGKVWSSNGREWQSRAYYEQERARTGRYEAGQAAERAEAQAANAAASQADSAETGRLAHEIAAEKATIASQAQEAAARNDAILARLKQGYAQEGRSTEEIDRLAGAGDSGAIADLYDAHLRRIIDAASAEAQSQAHWADAMAVGEFASKVALAGAKTGMMVAGGPAGYLASAVGSGVITSAESAAQTFVAGDDGRDVVKALATGFLSGAKDGVIGRYVNMPGVGAGTRILLPAAGDAVEAYARTGDATVALGSGLLSGVGGTAGSLLHGAGGSLLVRDGTQVLLSGALGAAGRGLTDGRAAEGFVDGLFNGVGSVVGGHLTGTKVPMTVSDIQMDQESAAAFGNGRALVEDFSRASTPEDKAAAVNRLLENHEAKLIMKSGAVDAGLKADFAAATDQHRTQVLFKETAGNLNQKYAVEEVDAAGVVHYRDVQPTDFKSGSGTAGTDPGMDLDMYAGAKIVDRQSIGGRVSVVKEGALEDAAKDAAHNLGIDPRKQEINVTSRFHAESFRTKQGEAPTEFIGRAGTLSPDEAQSVSEVTLHKLAEADALHGGGAVSLSEKCRTAMKDYERFTEPMLQSHAGAELPQVFLRADGVSGRTALDIVRAVGNGSLPPGTGNAQVRALTGMSLDSVSEKLAQLPEFIAKGAGTAGGARHDYTTYFLLPSAQSRDIAQAAVRNALRSATGEQ